MPADYDIVVQPPAVYHIDVTEIGSDGGVTSGVSSVMGRAGDVDLTDIFMQLSWAGNKTADYSAAAGEYVLFDCTAASRTLTLPTGIPNNTFVGVRMVLQDAGAVNTVTVQVTGGSGHVIGRPGSATTTALTLKYLNQGLLYQFKSGVWVQVASYLNEVIIQKMIDAYVPHLVTNNLGLFPVTTVGLTTTLDLSAALTTSTPVMPGHQLVQATTDHAGHTSDTTQTIDTGLSGITLVTSATYFLRGKIFYTSSLAGKIKASLGFPTGMTYLLAFQGIDQANSSSTNPSPAKNVTIDHASNLWQFGGSSATFQNVIAFEGVLITDATHAGALDFKYAQFTSDAVATVRKAGSWMSALRVA